MVKLFYMAYNIQDTPKSINAAVYHGIATLKNVGQMIGINKRCCVRKC